ncbi:Ger(x)C family spore germination protein [Gracilibacillus sp. S3-1-1]|uniref:Ger(X)C family spore germination protein n=1 Tax=Gracilibacillus pellucidus TaxID=3095368 RepID=A0ACC6M648_9BACI|nr:Ger(x)C family spore germination protein [Gracilibacillus sp. S3-1-1]MDX8046449.1 Ger(x)C family spore germination protein [Gracilibacillus sp. S3-1-1]
MRKLLIMFLFIALLLTGCWSAQELSDITLATAMAIDTADDGFTMTLQVLNPNEIAGDQRSDKSTISTYSASGNTVFEANRRLTQALPRRVHLSHLQLIVFGEELAKEGIGRTLDYLIRDHELRTDFTITIAQKITGRELISVLTPLEETPATKITSSIESSEDFWAPTKEVKLDELIESVTSEGKEAILTGIHVTGDPEAGQKKTNTQQTVPTAQIYLDGIGVFKGDKLQGWMNEQESKGFNYITDNVSNTLSWVECNDEGRLSLEITDSKTTAQGDYQNGDPVINIKVDVQANIGEVECAIDLNDPHELQLIQQKAEERTNQILKASIMKAQEFGSDIFGFGNMIKRAKPKEWEKVKENWSTIFPNLQVNVQSKVEMKQSGMINKPIYDTIKKKNQTEE